MKCIAAKRKIIPIILTIILVIFIGIIIFLSCNKTFFKNKYIGITNKEIFVPRFSYFYVDSGMHTAEFKSIKPKRYLEKEIAKYLESLDFYIEEGKEVYRKDNLDIYKYEVEDKGLYRQILITYN